MFNFVQSFPGLIMKTVNSFKEKKSEDKKPEEKKPEEKK